MLSYANVRPRALSAPTKSMLPELQHRPQGVAALRSMMLTCLVIFAASSRSSSSIQPTLRCDFMMPYVTMAASTPGSSACC